MKPRFAERETYHASLTSSSRIVKKRMSIKLSTSMSCVIGWPQSRTSNSHTCHSLHSMSLVQPSSSWSKISRSWSSGFHRISNKRNWSVAMASQCVSSSTSLSTENWSDNILNSTLLKLTSPRKLSVLLSVVTSRPLPQKPLKVDLWLYEMRHRSLTWFRTMSHGRQSAVRIR